jgi:hypothetical protein
MAEYSDVMPLRCKRASEASARLNTIAISLKSGVLTMKGHSLPLRAACMIWCNVWRVKGERGATNVNQNLSESELVPLQRHEKTRKHR